MLFNEFSSSPIERVLGRFDLNRLPSPTSFLFEVVFKGMQFALIWGGAMWLLQWSVIDMAWQTGVILSVAVGMLSGVWMTLMNRRSKDLIGEHRIGFQHAR